MPKEIPGFYYDAEKNRYFPYKGPVPGSSRKPPPPPLSNPLSKNKKIDGLCKCIKLRREKLLQAREVCGNVISSTKGKVNFQMEYQKRQVSQPLKICTDKHPLSDAMGGFYTAIAWGRIWKYHETKRMGNAALEHVDVDVTMPHGLIRREILLAGGSNNSLNLVPVGKVGQEFDPPRSYMADCVWPLDVGQGAGHRDLSRHLWSSDTTMTYMQSNISCIKMLRRPSFSIDDTASKHILITTLGSDRSGGLVYLLDLSKPLDFNLNLPIHREGFHEVASFKHTLWAADCDSYGRVAVIGTNRGAALLNMETGRPTWMYSCKSDVLSIQLDHTGNFILCGLRNGAIVTVDARQKQLKWNTHTSPAISMPSSVCCLASLKLYDQYFLASAMDGSIKLYDHRLTRRGPIQSYDGNVNSHTRLELGVDPSEKFVLSGGEDCYLRLWNIQSGKMLFEDRFMESIPSVVCWPRIDGEDKGIQNHRYYGKDHSSGAWLGSYDGIFYSSWL